MNGIHLMYQDGKITSGGNVGIKVNNDLGAYFYPTNKGICMGSSASYM
jgi:hypothetical protein